MRIGGGQAGHDEERGSTRICGSSNMKSIQYIQSDR
jgi:hypothetical protein